jgi:tetratricopeptide (TPR) repeat protein
MDTRAQHLEQITGAVRDSRPDAPVHRLLRVPPGGEGRQFVQDLAKALAEAGRRVVRLDLPEHDLDAGEHVLGQLCQALGLDAVPRLAWEERRTIHERVAGVTSEIGKAPEDAPVLALYVPRSWFWPPVDARRSLRDSPRSILEALLDPRLGAVVVTTAKTPWLEQRMQAVAADLPLPGADEHLLIDVDYWGAGLGTHAFDVVSEAGHLVAVAGDGVAGRTHLVLALGVACSALGYGALKQAFQKPDPYPDLFSWLQEKVKMERAWLPALQRLTLPRFPVDKKLMAAVAGDLTEPQQVLARCLLRREEGDMLIAEETLREIVGTHRRPEPEAHERLMKHYAAADEASTPREAAEKGNLKALLEAEHHRAHMGPTAPKGATPLSRLIQYERAWSWSVEFKEYAAAAAIYRDLVADDLADAYSHHYWAYNLDQAGLDGPTAKKEYKAAIEIERDNPWYNSRFINFLRDTGFRRDAHEAWKRAKEHVLPGPWAARIDLPRHFHRWIARSALDAGDLILASEVLSTLTPQDLKRHPKLAALHEELAQYEEIEEIGEPVYPARVPVADRWGRPLLLPERIVVTGRGRPPKIRELHLTEWYPGRVVSAEGSEITLVLARLEGRVPFTVEVDRLDLVHMANGVPPEVGRFLEYGAYGDDHARVEYHGRRPPRSKAEQEQLDHGLRYLRDEAAPKDA